MRMNMVEDQRVSRIVGQLGVDFMLCVFDLCVFDLCAFDCVRLIVCV